MNVGIRSEAARNSFSGKTWDFHCSVGTSLVQLAHMEYPTKTTGSNLFSFCLWTITY
jgi:hypothetical protein